MWLKIQGFLKLGLFQDFRLVQEIIPNYGRIGPS